MKKQRKKKYITVSTILILLKNLLFLPYRVTGGIAGVDEIQHLNILFSTPFIADNGDGCNDCLQYSLLIEQTILETVALVILCVIVIVLLLKMKKTQK